MTETDRPTLLLVATGSRRYREYLLRSIGPRYRVHLLGTAEPTWEHAYLDGWSVLATTLDADLLADAARKVAARQPVHGVLCWDEARILQSAHVATELGLPGGDVEMIGRCRDKHLTRLALADAGVGQPGSVLVGNVEEALAVADRIGYPVVLKPRALAASLGVVKVDTPEQLDAQFAFARDTTVPEAPLYDTVVLVEEYADGPEISVDTAVHDGRTYPMFVARKEIGYPPYFEEIGHHVDASDPLQTDPAIHAMIRETHAALGFTDGVTHTEIKLSRTGPKVIEVNARLGGDLIPYLGLRATGIDPGLAAAAVACGREPSVEADRKLVGAVRFYYADAEGVLEQAEFGTVTAEPAVARSIDLMMPLLEPGEVVAPPPKGTLWGRVAFATAVAPSVEEARAGIDAATAALRVRTAAGAAT